MSIKYSPLQWWHAARTVSKSANNFKRNAPISDFGRGGTERFWKCVHSYNCIVRRFNRRELFLWSCTILIRNTYLSNNLLITHANANQICSILHTNLTANQNRILIEVFMCSVQCWWIDRILRYDWLGSHRYSHRLAWLLFINPLKRAICGWCLFRYRTI